MQNKKLMIGALAASMVALIGAVAFPVLTSANAQPANTMSSINPRLSMNSTSAVTFQATAMSTVDTLPGHQGHQAAIVLPARSDGKMWEGTISWTASKPIELRLLFDYNSTITPDAAHGSPVKAPFGNGQAAIALIKPFNGPSIASSFNSGSMNFVAKQVAFHTINGTPFTVTYAVDAWVHQAFESK
jgi:hypothetical protein